MNHNGQMHLDEVSSVDCPFADLIESDDKHCHSLFKGTKQYEVISEDHPALPGWLADVGGVLFDDVKARPVPDFNFPKFLPAVKIGSRKYFAEESYPFVVISLDQIFNKDLVPLKGDIRKRLGVGSDTKIMLQCYGKDNLIERIWPIRQEIFPSIVSMNFDLITAINYSIWLDQPHAERLINLKRSLITFEEFQSLGAPVIPHIYWSGNKDLLRWAEWINNNEEIKYVAVNLQTERNNKKIWTNTISELEFLVSKLNRNIHFLITGPSVPGKINQVTSVLPSYSFINSKALLAGAHGGLISEKDKKLKIKYSTQMKSEIIKQNVNFYECLGRGIFSAGALKN